ncbi:MAG: hypothetical protein FJ363_11115 [Gemmatimonadetes bacterium]|nr:hypothetical protein [Gemmatimonadota bacterium]
MKRMMGTGLVAMLLAVTVQAQNSGLVAAGSNFSGPGGGGGGATGTVGAFLPIGFTNSFIPASNGMPPARGGVSSGFLGATGSANVRVGNITVPVDAAAQNAVANAVVSGNVNGFVQSLGSGMPPAAALALGNALNAVGQANRDWLSNGNSAALYVVLNNAVQAFNAAVNALPAGAPVPQSLIAARALLGGYYLGS